MTSPVRLVLGLLVMLALLSLLNLLLLRRVVSAFGLSARGRRALIAVLAVPLAGTVFFRALGGVLPVGFGEPVAVAVSAAELGVLIAASFVALAALVSAAARGGRRVLRRWRGNGLPDTPATPASEGRAGAARVGSDHPESQRRSPPLPESPSAAEEASSAHPGLLLSGAGGPGTEQAQEGAGASPALPRRAFVQQAAVGSVMLVGGGSAGYGALFGRHDYELSTVPVPIPGLPKAADGFTLVQLSDIHLGQMIGEDQMRAAEELVRKAKGDLIVLTGDLVDHDVRYTERLGRLVRRLAEIRPVVAVPGNHDYYTGIDEVLSTLRAAGATTLVNQSRRMLGERDGFLLVGLDDPWARRTGAPLGGRTDGVGRGPDLAAALSGAETDAPRIVLCHNPVAFVQTAGQVALQIAGHTHGGQVNLGIRPADYVLTHGYVAGLYRTNGSHLYVNRGFGTAGPAARVGAPPEVSRLVLVAG